MKKFYEFMTPENYKEALDAFAEAIEKIESLEEENEILEYALETTPFYSVDDFNKRFKMGWNSEKCAKMDRELFLYCRVNSIKIKMGKNHIYNYRLTAWDNYFGDKMREKFL